jgi:hypothetical protein
MMVVVELRPVATRQMLIQSRVVHPVARRLAGMSHYFSQSGQIAGRLSIYLLAHSLSHTS